MDNSTKTYPVPHYYNTKDNAENLVYHSVANKLSLIIKDKDNQKLNIAEGAFFVLDFQIPKVWNPEMKIVAKDNPATWNCNIVEDKDNNKFKIVANQEVKDAQKLEFLISNFTIMDTFTSFYATFDYTNLLPGGDTFPKTINVSAPLQITDLLQCYVKTNGTKAQKQLIRDIIMPNLYYNNSEDYSEWLVFEFHVFSDTPKSNKIPEGTIEINLNMGNDPDHSLCSKEIATSFSSKFPSKITNITSQADAKKGIFSFKINEAIEIQDNAILFYLICKKVFVSKPTTNQSPLYEIRIGYKGFDGYADAQEILSYKKAMVQAPGFTMNIQRLTKIPFDSWFQLAFERYDFIRKIAVTYSNGWEKEPKTIDIEIDENTNMPKPKFLDIVQREKVYISDSVEFNVVAYGYMDDKPLPCSLKKEIDFPEIVDADKFKVSFYSDCQFEDSYMLHTFLFLSARNTNLMKFNDGIKDEILSNHTPCIERKKGGQKLPFEGIYPVIKGILTIYPLNPNRKPVVIPIDSTKPQ